MKKLLLAVGLFLSSAVVGYAYQPHPAEAARPGTCVYCHGDRCGRGTIGSQWCETSANGCTEGGDACERI